MSTKYLKLLPVAAALLFGVFSARGQTPGGVTNPSYSWMAWMTPDKYSIRGTAIWENRFVGGQTIGNFVQVHSGVTLTNPRPAPIVTGYNFHPAARFASVTATSGPNQMESSGFFSISTGEAFTVIVVAKKGISPNGTTQDYILGYGTSNTTGGVWWESLNTTLHMAWGPTVDRTLGNAPSGVFAFDNPNLAGAVGSDNVIRWFSNGLNPTLLAAANVNSSIVANQYLRLGANRNNALGYRGFNGEIQEIIIFKRSNSGGALVAQTNTEIQKIISYLAIKYGIALSTDYVISDGTTTFSPWRPNTFTGFTGYNNWVFGIGRNDASALNQVQSVSMQSDLLTIFKGPLNDRNNNTPDNSLLTDKSFVMLGSNGLGGTTTAMNYGASIAPGDIINFRSNTIYRAQVTINGINDITYNQTINMKVTSTSVVKAKYIVVSNSSSFTPADTRVYPLVNGIATNVLVNHSDYISFIGFASTPGGVAGSYTWLAWLTPEGYSNGNWKNMITATGSLGNFTNSQFPFAANLRSAPIVAGYNFHQGVRFTTPSGTAAPNHMESSANFTVTNSESFSMFVVLSKARSRNGTTTTTRDHIFGYGTGNPNGVWWLSTNTNLGTTWVPGNATANIRNLGNAPAGIVAIDNPNSATALHWYSNGLQNSFNLTGTANGNNVPNTPLRIGASRASDAGTQGFNGIIHEIIILKKSSTGTMVPLDVQKIQSYLGIKYGISLDTLSAGSGYNYISSTGTNVWDRNDNTGFNINIFGIGRDDASGLNQKQSQSINLNGFVVYRGGTPRVPDLNSNNTGEFNNDQQFLMLGANMSYLLRKMYPSENIPVGTVFENGTADAATGYNIQSAVYKAQLTGLSSMQVGLKAASSDFTHVLVSTTPNFLPNPPGGTKIYTLLPGELTTQVEITDTYRYIKFIGYVPGPGGVDRGLALWLRADDKAAIVLEPLPGGTSVPPSAGGDPRLEGFNKRVDDPFSIPAVTEWRDLVRQQYYTYNDGPTSGTAGNNHRLPVMEYYSPELNYHPAVRFWGNANSYAAYLSNAATNVMPWNRPPNGHHTAYLMLNGDFSTNPWIYPFAFGSTDITTGNVIPRPGYGVERVSGGTDNGKVVGRFRLSGDETRGGTHLFEAGATTLLGYSTRTNNSGTNNPAYFRFNGKEDVSTTSSTAAYRNFAMSGINFQTGSTIGTGYAYDRVLQGVMSEVILYDSLLTAQETRQVESYMAIKYGVTLYPSGGVGRFKYEFSNNTPIWDGTEFFGPFVDFYNNVAAIIRDDAARLNNRHAHSTNVGSLLHVGVARSDGGPSYLSNDGSGVGSLNNLEAVAFGSNGATGMDRIGNPDDCGEFLYRFKRIWLIHNLTNKNIDLLIGAQNNAALTIGFDDNTTEYYNHLTSGFEVTLIVGESPAHIQRGEYLATWPMDFRYGEHQCEFTFPKGDVYITFGVKPNNKGCEGVVEFSGTKKFNWSQWTSTTNRTNTPGSTISITTPVDLYDGVEVLSSQVSYPAAVRPSTGYPRSVNSPEAGSIRVRRAGNNPRADVIVKITFNTPVVPVFSIADLNRVGTSNDEVEIYGTCGGSDVFLPRLSYATTAASSTYVIRGNMASVTKAGSVSGRNVNNGRVNVRFSGGVSELYIKYRFSSASRATGTGTYRAIDISPIYLSQVPPTERPNEHGISFSKSLLYDRPFSICEDVEFLFRIGNTNCEERLISLFSDTLPEKMSWIADRVGLDGRAGDMNTPTENPAYRIEILPAAPGRGEILNVYNIRIPRASMAAGPGLAELTAVAHPITVPGNPALTIEPGDYLNRAAVNYLWGNDPAIPVKYFSNNRQTGRAEPTPFTLEPGDPAQAVTIEPRVNRSTYVENNEITFTYTITNPNDFNIPDVYLDLTLNGEFTYMTGSFNVTGNWAGVKPVLVTPVETGYLSFAGIADAEYGFTIEGHGVIVITFKLKAPTLENLVFELDDAGAKISEFPIDLVVDYGLFSGIDDPCIAGAFREAFGEVIIPYSKGRAGIISNRNVTMEVKK